VEATAASELRQQLAAAAKANKQWGESAQGVALGIVGRGVKNPFTFIEEVRQEVSKVTWPAWKEVWITTAMVLVMVTLTAVFFLITDMIIGNVVNFVLRLGH
jgi:preprotein translocase subunit SecE